jgi:hypothetical protein
VLLMSLPAPSVVLQPVRTALPESRTAAINDA